MRVHSILLTIAVVSLVNSNVVTANLNQAKDSKLSRDEYADRHLVGIEEGGPEIKGLIEHLVHHQLHINEVFKKWCLEDHGHVEEIVRANTEMQRLTSSAQTKRHTKRHRDPETEALYKEYLSAKGLTGKKLSAVECHALI